MGRPLKVQKYSLGSGDGATNGIPVVIDQSFPGFASFDNAVPPVGGTNPPWLGVVGGLPGTPATTPTTPVVAVNINIRYPDGTASGVVTGAIVRQKGSRKYMVANSTPLTVNTALKVGACYKIVTLGTTDWTACGASKTYAVGDEFTATTTGTGTGTVLSLGTCVLINNAAPTPGNMNITFTYSDSTIRYISKLTARTLFEFSPGELGGSANTGDVWDWDLQITNERFESNFFTDEGYEIKSGTSGSTNVPGQQNQLPLGIVDSYTS